MISPSKTTGYTYEVIFRKSWSGAWGLPLSPLYPLPTKIKVFPSSVNKTKSPFCQLKMRSSDLAAVKGLASACGDYPLSPIRNLGLEYQGQLNPSDLVGL